MEEFGITETDRTFLQLQAGYALIRNGFRIILTLFEQGGRTGIKDVRK